MKILGDQYGAGACSPQLTVRHIGDERVIRGPQAPLAAQVLQGACNNAQNPRLLAGCQRQSFPGFEIDLADPELRALGEDALADVGKAGLWLWFVFAEVNRLQALLEMQLARPAFAPCTATVGDAAGGAEVPLNFENQVAGVDGTQPARLQPHGRCRRFCQKTLSMVATLAGCERSIPFSSLPVLCRNCRRCIRVRGLRKR